MGTSSEYSWSLGNSSIGPSGSEALTITYSPTNFGVDTGCIEINSDDPNQAVTTVDVTGEGVKKVSGGGGTDTSKVFVTKALVGEDGSVSGIAENGEILTYTITLVNTSKNQATIDVTEMVPMATIHTEDDDFNCAAITAGSTCDAIGVVIPGKVKGTNGETVLTFQVMVDTPFIDIQNVISIAGVDCALIENTCTVDTPADQDDVAGPDLVILSPVNGATVSENGFTVNGTVSDPSGVASVVVNAVLIDYPATILGDGTWTVDLPAQPPGTMVNLTVTAIDSVSNPTVDTSVTVTINTPDNTDPILAVLSPVNGATVANAFTVSGTASD